MTIKRHLGRAAFGLAAFVSRAIGTVANDIKKAKIRWHLLKAAFDLKAASVLSGKWDAGKWERGI